MRYRTTQMNERVKVNCDINVTKEKLLNLLSYVTIVGTCIIVVELGTVVWLVAGLNPTQTDVALAIETYFLTPNEVK